MKKLTVITCIILIIMFVAAGCTALGAVKNDAVEGLSSITPQASPEVRIENGVIQWRTGDGEWQDFMTLEALKAQYPEYFGATPTPEPEQTSEPTATPAATSSSAPTKSSSGSKATATPKPTAKVTATPKITATPLPQSSDSSGGGSSGGGSSSGDGEDIGWSDDQL
jgi:cell division septation protein DedD